MGRGDSDPSGRRLGPALTSRRGRGGIIYLGGLRTNEGWGGVWLGPMGKGGVNF